MKSFQVIRTHTSPYQKADFLARESFMIQQFATLEPATLETAKPRRTILITNTHTQLRDLPRELLRHTELIIHANSGYDHFEAEHDLWKDIPLVIGHAVRAQAVAEYSLTALFHGFAELPRHLVWQKDRTWDRALLAGQSVWVFGYGHIGRIVADTLSVLGMEVTVVDPYVKKCPHRCLKDWREGSVEDAAAVIAALSLNSTSRHLFNEDFFRSLSKKTLFINGARGKLVDEEALKAYLLANPEAFAFLDVFEREPFAEDWHAFPQVWKTSHIAGVEKDLDDKIISFTREVLSDFLRLELPAFTERYHNELLQNKWIEGALI